MWRVNNDARNNEWGCGVNRDYKRLVEWRESLGTSDHHIVGLMRHRHSVHKGVVKSSLCDGSARSLWHFSRGHIEVTHKDKVFWVNSPTPPTEYKPWFSFEGNATEGFFECYSDRKIALSSLLTQYVCFVLISRQYNLGVNMSVSPHEQVMCSFKLPCLLKATGSFSMRSPTEINSKYLCMASKGAYIADSTSWNKYWRKCCGGILLIDAVLFPF